MAEKNKFVVIEEKPKRGDDPYKRIRLWRILRIPLIVFSWILLLLLSLAAFALFTVCGCSSALPSELELTATKIMQMNATTRVLITQTALAREVYQVTATPDSAAIIITFMYLDQNHTPFVLLTEVTSGASPTATPTATSTVMPMSFSWATQDLPEVSAAAQAAFEQVDMLRDVTVRASAYGENCTGCGDTVVFGAMTTDFYLNAEVDSLSDLEAIAELITTAADVLSAPLGVELPAPLGYFDITLTAGDATGNLRTMFQQLNAARDQGLTGSALIDELGGITQRP